MVILGKPGPPEREDFYDEYKDPEVRTYLWHRVPALWREEIYDPEGRLKEAEVHGGKNGPRWTYEEHDPAAQEARAVYMPRIPESQEMETGFSFMVDPSEHAFFEDFWDGTIVDKTGRELAVAGRGCVEVRAKTVS
jgi:hypothetical protein